MSVIVARMPTLISNVATYAASMMTTAAFVNTLAYPTKISFSRVQNVELGAVISLEKTSPPMAALEDVSSEELTTAAVTKSETKKEILVAGTKGFYQGYTVTRVFNTEALHVSRANPEIQRYIAAATAVATPPIPTTVAIPSTRVGSTPIAPAAPTSVVGANPDTKVPVGPNVPENKVSPQDARPALPRGHNVSGEIELGGGMAFVGGGHTLTLKRYVLGHSVEEGAVHLQQGTFEIRVAEKKGRLVAQMQNEKKEVLGEGAYSFENSPQNIDDHIKIKLYAKSAGIAGQVISAYSYNDQKIVVTGAKLKLDDLDAMARSDEDGDYVFDGVSDRSVALMRSSAEGYIPSIQFVSGNQKNEVVLYPQKMVQSMVSLVEQEATALNGVIWGKVTADGKPVAGATIELAGVTTEPIYFNAAYIPDKRLKETSSNGFFAYLGIPPGLHQLRALRFGKSIDGTIVPVAGGHVSPIALEVPKNLTQVRVGFSDFVTPSPRWLSGVLKLFGAEETFNLKGDGFIPMAPHRLFSFFDGAVENFYPGRILSSATRDHIDLPMIAPTWLQDIVKEGGYKVSPNHGAILIQSDTPVESLSINGRQLELTDKDIIKVEGRGMLLVNVTSGVNTVVSKSAGKPDFDMNVVISDPGIVSVVDLRVVSGN